VPRTRSVLTDNVMTDIVDVGMTRMDTGLIETMDSRFGMTLTEFDVFTDDWVLGDNVDGMDMELLGDDDGLSTVLI
jgi:hypothetical protein